MSQQKPGNDGLLFCSHVSKLYPHQVDGLKWLWDLHKKEVGGILGDEMGMGKTAQILCFLESLHLTATSGLNNGQRHVMSSRFGDILVICPATLMETWKTEFNFWAPSANVRIYHRNANRLRRGKNSCTAQYSVVVTSYATCLSHQDSLLKNNWYYIVLDEGQKIRNPLCQISLAVKRFRTSHRIILTGTPIQNNLQELWSLMEFVFPTKLGPLDKFLENFAVPILQGGYNNATSLEIRTAFKCATILRDTVKPYILRRTKRTTPVSLPEKDEQLIFCRITTRQASVYKNYLSSRHFMDVLGGKYNLFCSINFLRSICNHPSLGENSKLLDYEDSIDEESRIEDFFYESGKLRVLKDLVTLWRGHRFLIFTQSRKMLGILESFAQYFNYSYLKMDGTTPIGSRFELVETFNRDNRISLFLLTTRVGGLGLSLVGADRVVIYDPDWNPSTDLQALERAWRIGQTKPVIVYRLICAGTIEEKIYNRQRFKQFISNRVLKTPKQVRSTFERQTLTDLFDMSDDKFSKKSKKKKKPEAFETSTKKRKAVYSVQKSILQQFKQDQMENIRENGDYIVKKETNVDKTIGNPEVNGDSYLSADDGLTEEYFLGKFKDEIPSGSLIEDAVNEESTEFAYLAAEACGFNERKNEKIIEKNKNNNLTEKIIGKKKHENFSEKMVEYTKKKGKTGDIALEDREMSKVKRRRVIKNAVRIEDSHLNKFEKNHGKNQKPSKTDLMNKLSHSPGCFGFNGGFKGEISVFGRVISPFYMKEVIQKGFNGDFQCPCLVLSGVAMSSSWDLLKLIQKRTETPPIPARDYLPIPTVDSLYRDRSISIPISNGIGPHSADFSDKKLKFFVQKCLEKHGNGVSSEGVLGFLSRKVKGFDIKNQEQARMVRNVLKNVAKRTSSADGVVWTRL